MKYPKSFTKMTLPEQESWLVKKLQELHQTEDQLKRVIAQVRNGYKYQPTTEERPDLEYELPQQ